MTVFFGSWCGFCKQHVPRLMKVVSEIAGSRIRVEFYGLPRAFGSHPVAGPLKIHGVPTGIVYMGTREVGRITGQQWTSPEVALENILPK